MSVRLKGKEEVCGSACYICSCDLSGTNAKQGVPVNSVSDLPVPLSVWDGFFKGQLPWTSGPKVLCKGCIKELSEFQKIHEQLLAMQNSLLGKARRSVPSSEEDANADAGEEAPEEEEEEDDEEASPPPQRTSRRMSEKAKLPSPASPVNKVIRIKLKRGRGRPRKVAKVAEELQVTDDEEGPPRAKVTYIKPRRESPAQESVTYVKRGRPRKTPSAVTLAEEEPESSTRRSLRRSINRPRRYSPSEEERTRVVVKKEDESEEILKGFKRIAFQHCSTARARGAPFYNCTICFEGFDTEEDFLYHFSHQHQQVIEAEEDKLMFEEATTGVDEKDDPDFKPPASNSFGGRRGRKRKQEIHEPEEEEEPGLEEEEIEEPFVESWHHPPNEVDPDEKQYFDEFKIKGEIKLVCRLCQDEYMTKEDFDLHFISLHPEELMSREEGVESLMPSELVEQREEQEVPELMNDDSRRSRISLKKPLFACSQRACTAAFYDAASLKRHVNTEHIAHAYKCPVCEELFSRFFVYRKHVVGHEQQGDAVFKCETCHLIVNRYKDLLRHRATHKEVGFECKYCKKQFPNRKDRRDHYNEHVVERPYLCGECGERFEGRFPLQNHMKVHSNASNSAFHCQLCKEVFPSRGERREHETAAHPCCPDCGKKDFNSFSYLVQHIAKIHRDKRDVRFFCDTCGQSFGYQSTLKKHQTSMHGNAGSRLEPGFQCSACGKLFHDKGNLQAHFDQFHAIEAKFVCHICNKRLGSRAYLNRHIERQHEKKQRYRCEHCLQTFTYPQTLSRHRRQHTNDRRFKCPFCEKCFTAWGNRHSHMFSHVDKKEYQCKHCGDEFPRAKMARQHVEHKHREFVEQPWSISIVKNRPFKYMGDGRVEMAGIYSEYGTLKPDPNRDPVDTIVATYVDDKMPEEESKDLIMEEVIQDDTSHVHGSKSVPRFQAVYVQDSVTEEFPEGLGAVEYIIAN